MSLKTIASVSVILSILGPPSALKVGSCISKLERSICGTIPENKSSMSSVPLELETKTLLVFTSTGASFSIAITLYLKFSST